MIHSDAAMTAEPWVPSTSAQPKPRRIKLPAILPLAVPHGCRPSRDEPTLGACSRSRTAAIFGSTTNNEPLTIWQRHRAPADRARQPHKGPPFESFNGCVFCFRRTFDSTSRRRVRGVPDSRQAETGPPARQMLRGVPAIRALCTSHSPTYEATSSAR